MDHHTETDSQATTSSDFTSSTGTGGSRATSKSGRLRRVITALSFERPPRSSTSRRNKQNRSNTTPKNVVVKHTTPPPPAAATASSSATPIPAASSSESLSESSLILSNVQVICQAGSSGGGVTKATLDESMDSNDVEVVFYDAVETGDGENQDEFDETKPHLDCVVLDNVIAVKPGGGSSLSSSSIEVVAGGDKKALQQQLKEQALAAPPETVPSLVRDPTWVEPPMAPTAPNELPLRFLRAGKGDVEEGTRRYQATLAWRKENQIDSILREPSPHFKVIKKNYPHFCHGKGRNGEPCYYEQPPKANLKNIEQAGCSLDQMLRHYTMVTEFQWQYLVRDDLMRSIYIIDLEGMQFSHFMGDVKNFVKRASALSSQHYPERAGVVFVINTPAWFQLIWKVVKPWVDEVTLKKIFILRDKEEIRRCMEEKIPPENLPQEYGGQSPFPLGKSPEEMEFARLVAHNNRVAAGDCSCGGAGADSSCRFCTWTPPRSY